MSGSSSMHGNSSSVVTSSGQPPGINGVKLEGQYYCNSYTPPTPVDHSLLPPSYSKFTKKQHVLVSDTKKVSHFCQFLLSNQKKSRKSDIEKN